MKEKQIEMLLVDDNSADVELTLHALRKENLANAIHVARDGEEALDFFFGCNRQPASQSLPKLVLLDLKMPKIDGMEVLRQIKANPYTRMIPVVILTSSKQEQDLISVYSLGANSYIQKPVNFYEFKNTIKNLGLYWMLINQPPPFSCSESATDA